MDSAAFAIEVVVHPCSGTKVNAVLRMASGVVFPAGRGVDSEDLEFRVRKKKQ